MRISVTDNSTKLPSHTSTKAHKMAVEPSFAQHEKHEGHETSSELSDVCTTSQMFDRWDGILDQSSITAPDDSSASSANISLKDNLAETRENEHTKYYKNRARCLRIFNDTEVLFRTQLEQLEDASSERIELQLLLQEDPDSILGLAARILSESILGIEHILKGNISVMEQVRGSLETKGELPKQCSIVTPLQRECGSPDDEFNDDSEGMPALSINSSSNLGAPLTEVDEALGKRIVKTTLQWNISSSEADPFVDTPQKINCEASPNTPKLEFHPDFLNLACGKLYEPVASDVNSTGFQSRRVVLNNLPPDATVAQVAKGVRCYGGIIAINMVNTSPFFSNNTKSAFLEFVYPNSAAEYVCAVQSHHLIYLDKNGDKYRAAAWLVPTPSFAYSYNDRVSIENGQTRALRLTRFPKKGVWYFLSAIGLRHIVDAKYDNDADELIVEFTTLFQASRAGRFVWTGMFSDIYYTVPGDSIQCSVTRHSSMVPSGGFEYESEIISHVSLFALKDEWNRKPFNEYWPTERKFVMQFEGLAPRAVLPPQPSITERLAAQYDIDEDEVADFLEERQNYKDTEFRILGSTITLTRRKWGWSITDEDETKLLMANTLHDPEWADEWDQHFKARGEVNLRTWEGYGMLAKHRREKAEQQGIEPGKVPDCKDCEQGCSDMKAAPVPEIVKKFLDTSNFNIVEVD